MELWADKYNLVQKNCQVMRIRKKMNKRDYFLKGQALQDTNQGKDLRAILYWERN